MPRNGSGTYTLPAGNPVVTGTSISSTVQNNTTSDIATALTNSLAKNGETIPTANLPMGGFKLTGLAVGTALTDSVAVSQINSGALSYLTTVAGTNTITAAAGGGYAAYAAGNRFAFIPAVTNTGATTLNINSIGAKNIFANGQACGGNELIAGQPVEVIYDGTQFNVIGSSAFLDTYFRIKGSSDASKQVRFEADGLTTATTRVLTVPDRDLTLGATLATPQASTSGTSIDFTSIPSWVRKITLQFVGVSTNGTSLPLVQIGAGSVVTTGYLGASAYLLQAGAINTVNSTAGFVINSAAAVSVMHGSLILSLENTSGTWVVQGVIALSDSAAAILTGGRKALGGTLDRVRITTVNGTDTFDAGEINILYE